MQNMTAVRKYYFVFSLTAVTNEPLKLYLWPVSRSGLRSKICKTDSDAKWADTWAWKGGREHNSSNAALKESLLKTTTF
jgi:hypothetical protein